MSEIDGYKHKLIGFMKCPFEPGLGSTGHDWIPIYKILEGTESGSSFSAKSGDIILGGGSGEIFAMRVSMPEAAFFLTLPDWDSFSDVRELYQEYWPPEAAYLLCAGFRKIGWDPASSGIETWLAGHLVSFLRKHCSGEFEGAFGTEEIEEDGSICRVPYENEVS